MLDDVTPVLVLAVLGRLLAAALLVQVGWVLGNLAAKAVERGVERTTGRRIKALPVAARWAVRVTALILALGQLGVETSFLVIATAIALGAIGLALALVTSRAGGDLARQAAHGRYLRRHLSVGDHVEGADWAGVVVRIDAASLVLDDGSGAETWVPNATTVEHPIRVTRRGRPTG